MRAPKAFSGRRKTDMPTPPRHYAEELDALLDGRLDDATRAAVEAHLGACEECRRAHGALRWTKQFAAARFAAPDAPAELREKILRSLRAGTIAEVVPAPPRRAWRRPLALALAASIALAAVLAGVHFFAQPALPVLVAEDFRAYRAQQLPLDLATADVKELERFFTAGGVPFATRVFDLGMMDYRLVGGRVHRLAGQPGALFVYRNSAGEELVCQMFAGRVAQLPAGAERRTNKGREFFIYKKDTTTAVFWQEGAVVCVLASDIAPENVVQLAYAKAMP